MMSIRQLTRSIPRATSRLTTSTTRRTIIGLSKPSPISQAWKVAPAFRSLFSTGAPRFEQSGSIDHELSSKLASEIQLEAEAGNLEADDLPQHLKNYLDQNPWEIIDKSGSEEVILKRRFGKENIKVVFSIADISDFDHDPDSFSEDPSLYDEDSSLQQGGAQTKGSVASGRTPNGNVAVDSSASAEVSEDAEEDLPPTSGEPESFPARLQVTITKDGMQGALYIEALVRDGEIMTENVLYFPNSDLAEAKTAEQDWSRRTLYTGPPFANLDEDLQALVDQYTAERGVDTALALFIPEYMDWKEQREYVGWLQATKAFIDA